jgi:signal transduction histidine kinase
LIHRDSGLLLEHLAREPEATTDRDLASQAPHFTPDGGQVSIDVITLDDALAAEVSDSGSASPQKTRPASCSSSFALTRRGSSGFLVLAWVCPSFGAIVEQHGGEAYCRRQSGEGSTFGFALPVTGE